MNFENQNIQSPQPPVPEKSPKKNNLIPIIIGLVIVIIAIVIVVFVVNNKDSNHKTSSDNTKTSSENKKDNKDKKDNKETIKKITFSNSNVIALSNKNNLYIIGDITFINDFEKITLYAKDVIDYENGNNLLILDKNRNLFISGLDIIDGGGTIDTPLEIYKNVKNTGNGAFCVLVTDENDNAYINGLNVRSSLDNCGLTSATNGFVKIGENIKSVFGGLLHHGYITNKGELYVITGYTGEYKKILDHIVDYNDNVFLTEDNKLYSIKYDENEIDPNGVILTEVASDVKDIDGKLIEKTNGKLYTYNNSREFYLIEISDEVINKVSDKEHILDINNRDIIYLNEEGKLVLRKVTYPEQEVKEITVDNTIDSMEEIYDFYNYFKK